VHAGLVIGWVHKPVALTIERRYGRGRFVVSAIPRSARSGPDRDALLDSLMVLALAQGSAASRDREAVINDMVERARAPSAVQLP
jgi:hypothetical protein